jgi:pantoate--beta-alanine ligase
MRLCQSVAELKDALAEADNLGKTVGFVPTMGALHEGHLSLLHQAQQDGHFTVVSVFVNPLQFGEQDDFESYPRTIGVDARLLTDAGADVLFAPNVNEVYPPGKELLQPEVGPLGDEFEGAARPGHFAGMLKVVNRLFDLVNPDAAYFGEKDAQQAALVKNMVRGQIASGAREPLKVVICPTLRESSSLAFSSRNRRLSASELEIARGIYPALQAGAAAGPGVAEILAAARAAMPSEARLDYLELVDPISFAKVDQIPEHGARLIVAAWVGSVRLIDNILIGG